MGIRERKMLDEIANSIASKKQIEMNRLTQALYLLAKANY
jgi:hypothetical protein